MVIINPIDMDEYQDFALYHFRHFGKDIEPEAIQSVYNSFHGVTLYLQRIMKDAFNITPQGECCDVKTVNLLVDNYVLESDVRLREQLSFVSETQKALLYAIHEEANKASGITSAKFIKKHRLTSSSAVQSAAKKLLEYDFITRNEGIYSISAPLMARGWTRCVYNYIIMNCT